MPTIAFVSRLPAPYRETIFQRIHERGAGRLHVLYQMLGRAGTAWQAGRTGLEQRFTYDSAAFAEVIDGDRLGVVKSLACMRWVWRELSRLQPDLVISHGYSYPAVWSALAWALTHGRPYALRSDSNGFINRPCGLKGWIKRQLLGALVARCQTILAIGSANLEYWKQFGARPEQFVHTGYSVDHELFRPEAETPDEAAGFRRRHGLEGRMVFLFVGRLIERKHCRELLAAFLRLAAERADVALVVAGRGPLEEELKAMAAARSDARVVFLGTVEYRDMPALYRSADLAVLPYEREPWGLTLNEAMACGLPVVAIGGGTCGAAVDLIGRGGWLIGDAGEETILAALRRAVADPAAIDAMRREALKEIGSWGPERTVEGILEAGRRAISISTRPGTHDAAASV